MNLVRSLLLYTSNYLSDSSIARRLKNQVTVLKEIAEKKGFHLTSEPEKWYSVTKQDFLAHKVGCCFQCALFG